MVSAILYYSVIVALAIAIIIMLFFTLRYMRLNSTQNESLNKNDMCIRAHCSDDKMEDVDIDDDPQRQIYKKTVFCLNNGVSKQYVEALKKCGTGSSVEVAFFHSNMNSVSEPITRIDFFDNWYNNVFLSDEGCGSKYNNQGTSGADIDKDTNEMNSLIAACKLSG